MNVAYLMWALQSQHRRPDLILICMIPFHLNSFTQAIEASYWQKQKPRCLQDSFLWVFIIYFCYISNENQNRLF